MQHFTPVTKTRQQILKSIKPEKQLKRIVVNGKQRCGECFSIRLVAGKLTKLQDATKKYIHAPNCAQIGRF